MESAAIAVLSLLAAVSAVLTARGESPSRSYPPNQEALAIAAGMLGALGLAALFARAADGRAGGAMEVGILAAGGLAAVLGGGPLSVAVLRLADPAPNVPALPPSQTAQAATQPNGQPVQQQQVEAGPADPNLLRGGAWIGALERIAAVAVLLAGWPDGLLLSLAVKGLARYPELRRPAAPERFVIGTLVSLLWAGGCAGVVLAMT